MGFFNNDYLNWYVPMLTKGEGAINLHSSGAPAFDFDPIEADTRGSPWDRFARLESKLAGWLGIPTEEMCLAPGATGGTMLALLTLSKLGDSFLVESPIYEPMRRQAERLGPVTRFECKMDDEWRLPLDQIETLMRDSTSVVLITEPSNPGGTFRKREDVLALADIADRHDATLLINEVYRGYSDAPSFHLERDNIVVVSSFSKLLGFYGLRFGWLSASKELVRKLKVAHMNMSMLPQPLASIGLAVFDQIDSMRERIVQEARIGAQVVDSFVSSTSGTRWIKPHGPGFGCVALPEHLADDVEFTKKLYEEQDVLAIPGSFFEVPGTLRLSWLQAGDRLEEGLRRLAASLSV